MNATSPNRWFVTEAQSLRDAPVSLRCVPLVANPHVAACSVLLERWATSLRELGAHALVVDAADTSPRASALARVDLAACVEPLGERVSYLAARDLPQSFADHLGSCGGFLQALQHAAMGCDVALVHASAPMVVRMFHGQAVRPVVIAGDDPESIMHAFVAMKLLVQRCEVAAFDLAIVVAPGTVRATRIAQHLTACAEQFLHTTVHAWAAVDPHSDVREPASPELQLLAESQWRFEPPPMPTALMQSAAAGSDWN